MARVEVEPSGTNGEGTRTDTREDGTRDTRGEEYDLLQLRNRITELENALAFVHDPDNFLQHMLDFDGSITLEQWLLKLIYRISDSLLVSDDDVKYIMLSIGSDINPGDRAMSIVAFDRDRTTPLIDSINTLLDGIRRLPNASDLRTEVDNLQTELNNMGFA